MSEPEFNRIAHRRLVAECRAAGTLTIALNCQAYGARYAQFRCHRRYAMDWNRVEVNWKQIKGKVKEKWGNFTDDDLDKIAGRRDQLEGKIQERYGLAKDQVRKDVDDWMKSQRW